MATRITTCPKCESTNITTLDPEKTKTVSSPTVDLKAKCNECEKEFTYPAATDWGRRSGILY